MKKNITNLTLLLLSIIALTSCGNTPINSINNSTSKDNSLDSTSSSIDDNSNDVSYPNSDISSDSESSGSQDSSGDSTSDSSSGQTLPIGNTTVSKPSNTSNIDITSWYDFDLTSSLPEYFSYIQGNNKVNNCFDFYSSTGGGFKFSHLYYGLQTPLINSWKKVEVRLNISTVTNNTKTKEDKPIFHIYSYDKNGNYIQMDTLDQGTITTSTVNNYVQFYIKNTNMSYFELRLNAFPYKGSQCYNFGVNKISLKGWDYE